MDEINHEEMLMTKITWFYYIENMTQQKISELLAISRARVIKLLEKARQTGMVQFKIRENRSIRMKIERDLVSKYGLVDAFISATNESEIPGVIAKTAAMYISGRIGENGIINMGFGATTGAVLNELAKISEMTITCVSLTGGVNCYLPNVQSSIFNAKLKLIPFPLVVASKEIAEAIKNEPSLDELTRMTRLASVSVVGIGSMSDNATVVDSGILTKNDMQYIKMRGAVGDILCQFIDKDGELIKTSIDERLISTPLNTLKELDNVVGVAAGISKVEAIKAALKRKCLDVLITDEETALELTKD